jgi:hypothetical protein
MFTEQEVYNQFKVQAKLDDKYKICWEDLVETTTTPSSARLEFNDEKAYIRFEAHDVKWYEDYPDVKCHHALLDLAEEYAEKYECVSWQFVRVGEEVDDIESKYGGNGDASSYVYPVSGISWDMPHE